MGTTHLLADRTALCIALLLLSRNEMEALVLGTYPCCIWLLYVGYHFYG
jgi:hypothetical protein